MTINLDKLYPILDQLDLPDLERLRQYIVERQIHANRPTAKIGILGDIHGDYSNFIRALTLFEEAQVTHILCTGDIVDRGADADLIIQFIKIRDIVCVAGNHEHTIIKNQVRWRESANPQRLQNLGRIVNDETLDFLATLPDSLSLTIAHQRILLAHGTPWSDVMTVFPDSRQSTFERLLSEYGTDYDILILGHTHQPMHAMIEHLHIFNAGSIYGITGRDSHTCAILSLPDYEFTVYDVETGWEVPLLMTSR